MAQRTPRTGLTYHLNRDFPAHEATRLAQEFAKTGVVDDFIFWDQLTSWWPHVLWTRDVTPLAEVMSDTDSFPDAGMVCAFAAAAQTELGVAMTSDTIRNGPAELLQRMLTLAGATEGRATLFLGAGEVKQCKPFGYSRKDGLARMEDYFRIFDLLLTRDGPVDFDGKVVRLRQAWIGSARPYRPKFWAMGGGPTLRDIATKYADGLITLAPNVFATPEQWAQEVLDLKLKLERNGRDPDAFEFGLWIMTMQHDDPEVIQRALKNPLTLWLAACFGRLNQADWAREGETAAFPNDWHYALRLLPAQMTRAEVDAINARVTPSMAEKSFLCGPTKEVAATIQDYVDAGATYISTYEMTSFYLPLEEAVKQSLNSSVDVYRLIKQLA